MGRRQKYKRGHQKERRLQSKEVQDPTRGGTAVLTHDIIHKILKLAITDLKSLARDYGKDMVISARLIQTFLCNAALVHPTWTPVAQELLFHNAVVPLSSHQGFLDSLKLYKPEVTGRVSSVMILGEVDWYEKGEEQLGYASQVRTDTAILKKVIKGLKGLISVDLIRMRMSGMDWLSESGHIQHVSFYDSAALLPGSAPIKSHHLSPSLSFAPSRKSITIKGNLDVQIQRMLKLYPAIRQLSLDSLGADFAMSSVSRIGRAGGPSCSTIKELTIRSQSFECGYAHPVNSPWESLTALHTLHAPFSILPDMGIRGPGISPFNSHALPPSLRRLYITAESGPRPPLPRSVERALVASWTKEDAHRILIAAIEKLPLLELLSVEECLHCDELRAVCEGRGIELRRVASSVHRQAEMIDVPLITISI